MKLHEARDPWLRNARPMRRRMDLRVSLLAALTLAMLVQIAVDFGGGW